MSNTDSDTFPIVIDAGNDMTEIVLVDSRFQKVAEGLRRVEQEVPAGLYLVKTRLGESTRERFISVPAQTSLIDAPDDTPISAQFPLLDLLTWKPDELQAERTLRSGTPFPVPGMGIVSVFIRDAPSSDSKGTSAQHSMRRSGTSPDQISLRDLNGRRLVSLDGPEENASTGPSNVEDVFFTRVVGTGPVTGFIVVLPVGGYILQSRSRNINTVGMAVWVAERFDTRVYLERRLVSSVDSKGRPDRRRIADLSRASIVLVRPDVDIAQGEAAECLRVTEMARTTLATERPIFPRNVLMEHILQKFQYPMLGILGAHLLALQTKRGKEPSQSDMDLVQEVANNLETYVLPGNPDVAALYHLVGQGYPPVENPPMLRVSWNVLASHASTKSGVVAPGSVADWVGLRLTTARPWLIWNGAAKRVEAFDELRDGANVSATIAALRRPLAHPATIPVLKRPIVRSPAAELVAESRRFGPLVTASSFTSALIEAARQIDPSLPDPLTELSVRLNIPRSTVANALLAMKITE